jgi:D-alanine-D-alanine ligase
MKKIAIFCGGFSSEFEISMKSATTILTHFPEEYDAFLVEVTKTEWTAVYKNMRIPFSPWGMCFEWMGNPTKIDAGLIYIHGNPGENGKIQALLEMQDIPCVNSGALASELSFDKWYCNQFLKSFGINVAKSNIFNAESEINTQEIIAELGLPLFVKPTDSGSSYGISKVKEESQLKPAIEAALKEGNHVVVESFLDGTEVTCGVYRNANGLTALPLTEIVTENDFFDYEAKYLGKSSEITPARISEENTLKIQETATKIYALLNLKSIARIDFMLVNDTPFVIEVNTTPGFSPASIVPKMLETKGISIREFWREILTSVQI